MDVEDDEEDRLGVADGLDGCGRGGGLVQLDFRISTFDDFHNSEFGGRIALGSINEEATFSLIINS